MAPVSETTELCVECLWEMPRRDLRLVEVPGLVTMRADETTVPPDEQR